MWNQYKKTAVMTQAFIAITCVTVYFGTGRQALAALIYFAVMQVGAVLGALWASSIRARRDRVSDALPLSRRRASRA